MSPRTLHALLLLALCLGCGPSGGYRQPTSEHRLSSGRLIKVTSCLLVWGADHEERHPNQDSFALEYVSSLPRPASKELDKEAVEVFELIRPISEQWGFTTASVAAFPSAQRTGPYDIFFFSRSPDGHWSFVRHSAKVYNTKSGRDAEGS